MIITLAISKGFAIGYFFALNNLIRRISNFGRSTASPNLHSSSSWLRDTVLRVNEVLGVQLKKTSDVN